MKHRAKTAFFTLLCASTLAACGGGGGVTPQPTPAPTATPTPSPTPLNTPIIVLDENGNQALSIQVYGTGSSYARTFLVQQSGYNGTFTTSGCSGIATASAASDGTLTVTGDAAGTCTLTIGDSYGDKATLPVSVTTTSVVAQ